MRLSYAIVYYGISWSAIARLGPGMARGCGRGEGGGWVAPQTLAVLDACMHTRVSYGHDGTADGQVEKEPGS